jgi:hypothetical protein
MADNSNNILNQLQQHSVQPPAGAFEKAWQAIVQEEQDTAKNDVDADRKTFSQLQEHTMVAPAFDFNAISKTKPPSRIIPVAWLRAAAVLLLLGIASFLYFGVFKQQPKNLADNFATSPAATNNAPLVNNKQADDYNKKDTLSTITPPVATAIVKPAPSKKNSTAINNAGIKKSNTAVKTNNQREGQLYDNDMLFTLVNYKNRNWQQFFTKAITDKKVTLNKYSYHNLTDKMVEMLQDMYLVKGNGKPTRKAKKTKRKFEKWRKKDEKYFDKNLQKNPADIIDLSEFILKNN